MWNFKLFKFCVRIGWIPTLLIFSTLLIAPAYAISMWFNLSKSQFLQILISLVILILIFFNKYVNKYSPNRDARVWLYAGAFNKNCSVHMFIRVPTQTEIRELISFAVEMALTTKNCTIIFDSPLLMRPKLMKKLKQIVQSAIPNSAQMSIKIRERRLNFFERIVFISAAWWFNFSSKHGNKITVCAGESNRLTISRASTG